MSNFPTEHSGQYVLNQVYDESTKTLKTSGGGGSSSTQVQGTAADNAAAVGNPLRVGQKHNSSTQTYADGDIADFQADVNGNTKVREQYAPGYEDNTNSKAIVEHRYTSFSVTADTLIKSGAGLLHTITLSGVTATPTAGLITVYDSTTETGTALYSEWFFATDVGHTITLDVLFATGLYVGLDGTAANIRVSGSYR